MKIEEWFSRPGAYVMFDGQFGSTGKGALAAWLAHRFRYQIDMVTTNQGPNSGHTAYCPVNGEKIVTKQLPIASVIQNRMGVKNRTHINSGAIINADILGKETMRWSMGRHGKDSYITISPYAAFVRPEHVGSHNSDISSTGQGVGPAMADKVNRKPHAVIGKVLHRTSLGCGIHEPSVIPTATKIFVEVAQGYSLGINAGFYPYTTSRDCGIAQALNDAKIPVQLFRSSIATLRTFPIRVGNTTDGYSGDGYPDQTETTWEALGQEPELTTVTGRVRRVFTWSRLQFMDMLATQRPECLFVNFMNYLPREEWATFLGAITDDYRRVMGTKPRSILIGTGPKIDDISKWVM